MTRHTPPPADPNQLVLAPPRRRLFTSKGFLTVLITWMIGQLIELNRALASKIEVTETKVRGAARNNTLTISYDHPSLIGPWGNSMIFWIIVAVVVALLFIRWVIKKLRQSGTN